MLESRKEEFSSRSCIEGFHDNRDVRSGNPLFFEMRGGARGMVAGESHLEMLHSSRRVEGMRKAGQGKEQLGIGVRGGVGVMQCRTTLTHR